MRIASFFVEKLCVESECPKCGKTSGTDMGGYFFKNLPSKASFWCSSNEECGGWEEPFSFMPNIVPYPSDKEPVYNNNIQCDMLEGPCACGSWHKIEE